MAQYCIKLKLNQAMKTFDSTENFEDLFDDWKFVHPHL